MSGGDKKTRRFGFDPDQIDRLLAVADEQSTGQQKAVDQPWLTEEIKRWLGKQLGPFQIADYLDGGGMSLVFRAQRNDGQYEQQVAIKVLRAPDVAELVQRFERERRLLASLYCPHCRWRRS